MDKATGIKFAQKCLESRPTIVLGSGASMAHDYPGMDKLTRFLTEHILPEEADQNDWRVVQENLKIGNHLEQALADSKLSNSLLKQVIQATWECINEADLIAFKAVASEQLELPLQQLLRHLFTSTANYIDIVTTNYDRLVEMACNASQYVYWTGFDPGIVQQWKPDNPIKMSRNGVERTIRIYKVHGSLDWFQREDSSLVALPFFKPDNERLMPQIVTPGFNKYQETSREPFRTIIAMADERLRKASAFLTVGYGFRDEHIEPKIAIRCKEPNVPILVLAHTLTNQTKDFLIEKVKSNFLALEASDLGTKAYSNQNPDGVIWDQPECWSLGGFLRATIQ